MDMKFDQPNPFAPRANLKIWLDGRLVPVAEAKISVFDHGLLYGDGVFEGLAAMPRRFSVSTPICSGSKARPGPSGSIIPMTRAELSDATYETLKANDIIDGYIRLVVTRGVGYLGLSPRRRDCPAFTSLPTRSSCTPKRCTSRAWPSSARIVIRNHPNAVSPRIKSLNYLNNILAKIEVRSRPACRRR